MSDLPTAGYLLLAACLASCDMPEFRRVPVDILNEGETVVWTAVAEHIKNHGSMPQLETVTEAHKVLKGCGKPVEPPSVYAERLRARKVHEISNAGVKRLSTALTAMDPMAAVNHVAAMLQEMRRVVAPATVFQASDVAVETLDEMRCIASGTRPRARLGWDTVDRKTGGVYAGDVATFVGRPGVGKTSVMVHSCLENLNDGLKVLFVSMEMRRTQVFGRLLGESLGINYKYISRGELDMWSLRMVEERAAAVPGGLHFMDGSGIRVGDVEAACAAVDPDVLMIDASYLLKPMQKTGLSRHEMLFAVESELKEMAHRRGVPLIKSVQFNREVKARDDTKKKKDDEAQRRKMPSIESIGGTDSIAQLSSVVVAVERGEKPRAETTRIMSLLKCRDSEDGQQWTINFGYSPPDFTEIDGSYGNAI
jgi:replicative DNA helicase